MNCSTPSCIKVIIFHQLWLRFRLLGVLTGSSSETFKTCPLFHSFITEANWGNRGNLDNRANHSLSHPSTDCECCVNICIVTQLRCSPHDSIQLGSRERPCAFSDYHFFCDGCKPWLIEMNLSQALTVFKPVLLCVQPKPLSFQRTSNDEKGPQES